MAKKKAKSTERGLGVILEKIDSKVERVLEGQHALEIKFDKKIDVSNDKIDTLHVGHKALLERVDDLSKSSKQILSYLTQIDEEIQEIKAGLRQKADLSYVRQVEARVTKVEFVVQKYFK